MLILGIDTTTLSCSTALMQDDQLLAEMTLNIRKTHSERLMPLIDSLLKESMIHVEDIDAIAVAVGPGSFTGLRIGVATARALAQGLKIPAVAVPTLEALAEVVPSPGVLICPLLDARRGEVYSALFRRKTMPPFDLEAVFEQAAQPLNALLVQLKQEKEPVVFIGEGVAGYEEEIRQALSAMAVITAAPFRLCRGALVALRGRQRIKANPDSSYAYNELLPIYLRRPEAERMAEEKSKRT